MDALAKTGARIRVIPGEDLSFALSEHVFGYIRDRSPFELLVSGILIHDNSVYGVYGPVVSGPRRYDGLICSLLVRTVPAQDWRRIPADYVNFKIGPSVATRDPTMSQPELGEMEFFYHPDGTSIDGYPRFSRFGYASVVEGDQFADTVVERENII